MRRRQRIMKMEIDRESKIQGKSAAVLKREKNQTEKMSWYFSR